MFEILNIIIFKLNYIERELNLWKWMMKGERIKVDGEWMVNNVERMMKDNWKTCFWKQTEQGGWTPTERTTTESLRTATEWLLNDYWITTEWRLNEDSMVTATDRMGLNCKGMVSEKLLNENWTNSDWMVTKR